MVWANNNYLWKRQLTLAQASGTADLTSFPVLVSTTQTDLKTVANGGVVQNATAFDIIFYDSTESTLLAHNIERYDPVNGVLVFWVSVPTLSHTGTTNIFMYYDYPAVPNAYQGAGTQTTIWTNAGNYLCVEHLGNGTTLSVADSSASANNGTNNGATVTASGKIDGGASFNGSSAYIGEPNIVAGNAASITLSCWFNSSTANGVILDYAGNDPPTAPTNWSPILLIDSAGKLRGELNQGSIAQITSTGVVNNGAWHYVVLTNAASLQTLYLDGASVGTLAGTANTAITPNVHLGTGYSSSSWGTSTTAWNYFNGLLDEFRISNTARSAGWIATEYANQNAPATFVTVGASTSSSVVVSKNSASRLRLQSAAQQQNVASRFKLAVVAITGHDLSSRLRLLATVNKDSPSRMRLASPPKSGDLSARFRLAVVRQRDSASRLRLLASTQRDQVQRLRLASPAKLADLRQRFNIVAPLSLYGTNTATATLSTANGFDTVTGGTATSTSSSLSAGTTGFGEIYSQGSSPAWASGNGAGALGSPSGHGWLYDAATLVGQMTIAGNWQSKITLATSVTFTTSLVARWYKYNGTYTPIGSANTLSAQTITAQVTPVTLYGLTAASVTLATAANFASVSGGTSALVNTVCNTGTGFYELRGLGGTSTAVGSVPAPTGRGWLWDVTTLVGNTLVSGSYTFIVAAQTTSGVVSNWTMTARLSKRSSAGVFTTIATTTTSVSATPITTTLQGFVFTLPSVPSMGFVSGDKLYVDYFLGATLGSSITLQIALSSTASGVTNAQEIITPGYLTTGASPPLFTFPTQSVAATNFNTGDKLYMDLWANITGAPASAATLACFVSSSTSLGVAGDAELDTPGYIGQPGNVRTLDFATRLNLASAAQTKDSQQRFRLSVLQTQDTTSRLKLASPAQKKDSQSRLRLSATKTVDTASRYKLAIQKANDTTSRLKLASAAQNKDSQTRLKLLATKNVDTAQRLKLQGPPVIKDVSMRVKLAATKNVDLASRYRLAALAGLHDQAGRYRLAVTKQSDTTNRFRVQVTKNVDSQTRFKLFITKPNDTTSRLKLASAAQNKDSQSRLRLSATRNADLQSRFKLSGVIQNKDMAARSRFAAFSTRDLASRLKLSSGAGLHDATMRVRLSATRTLDSAARVRVAATQTRDLQARQRLASAPQLRDVASRVQLAIQKRNDAQGRLKLSSSPQLRDVASRLRLFITKKNDLTTRLRMASASVLRDSFTRLRVSVTNVRDVTSRLRLLAQRPRDLTLRVLVASAAQTKNVASRLKLASTSQLRDVASRLKLASTSQLRDVASRVRLFVTNTRDSETRLRLRATTTRDLTSRVIVQTVNGRIRDIASRAVLRATATRDSATRFKLALQKNVAARLWLAGTNSRDTEIRLKLASTSQLRDVASRVLLASSPQRSDVASRLRMAVLRTLDHRTRVLLASLPASGDTSQRIRLASLPVSHDVQSLLRLFIARTLDVQSRLRVAVTPRLDARTRFFLLTVFPRTQDYPARMRVAIQARRDVVLRFQVRSPNLRDCASRLVLTSPVNTRDTGCRFNLALLPRNAIMQVRRGDITLQVRKGDIVMEVVEN